MALPYGADRKNLTAYFVTSGDYVSVNNVRQNSGVTANNFSKNPVYYVVHAEDGSTKTYSVFVSNAQDDARDITSFSINGNQGKIEGSNIHVTLPYGTSLSNLRAEFTTTGDAVYVKNEEQISGVTSNDFTNPVYYRVVAQNGEIKRYLVNVQVAVNSAKQITNFSIDGTEGIIIGTSITLKLPYKTPSLNDLVAKFTTNGIKVEVGGRVQLSGITPNNFDIPVRYVVTAEDNSFEVYTVTVSRAMTADKDFLSFSINGVDGVIGYDSISLELPIGTDLSRLTADFIISGVNVFIGNVQNEQISGETFNDFTAPLFYTVVAGDGSIKAYRVIATAPKYTEAKLLAMSLPLQTRNPDVINGRLTLNLPYESAAAISSLSPSFVLSPGAKAYVNGIEQINGKSAHNFTNPVTYTIRSQDELSSTTYQVVATSSSKPNSLWVSSRVQGGDFGDTSGADYLCRIDLDQHAPSYGTSAGKVAAAMLNDREIFNVGTQYVNPKLGPIGIPYGTDAVAKNAIIFQGSFIDHYAPAFRALPIDGSSIIYRYLWIGRGCNNWSSSSYNVHGANVRELGNGDVTSPYWFFGASASCNFLQSLMCSATDKKSNPPRMSSFEINGVNGSISNGNISVRLNTEQDLTKLTASFSSNGTAVYVNGVLQVSGVTTNDFSRPVIYTVMDIGGNTTQYSVSVGIPSQLLFTCVADGADKCACVRQNDGSGLVWYIAQLKEKKDYNLYWWNVEKNDLPLRFNNGGAGMCGYNSGWRIPSSNASLYTDLSVQPPKAYRIQDAVSSDTSDIGRLGYYATHNAVLKYNGEVFLEWFNNDAVSPPDAKWFDWRNGNPNGKAARIMMKDITYNPLPYFEQWVLHAHVPSGIINLYPSAHIMLAHDSK